MTDLKIERSRVRAGGSGAGVWAAVRPGLLAAAAGGRTAVSALVFPLILLVVWEITARRGLLPPQILPAPGEVLAAFRSAIATGDLAFHAAASLLRVLEGFVVGASAGFVVGAAMGLSSRIRDLLDPLFLALAQIPPIGWVPLLMLFVGIDEALKVIIIAKAAMIPVTLNTYKGFRGVPRAYREVGEVLTFTPWQTLGRIVLPAAVPSVFTGLRSGLGNAWLALVGVELIASSEGLGYLIVDGRQLFQLDSVIMAMITVGAIGFALDAVLGLAERHVQRWEIAR